MPTISGHTPPRSGQGHRRAHGQSEVQSGGVSVKAFLFYGLAHGCPSSETVV